METDSSSGTRVERLAERKHGRGIARRDESVVLRAPRGLCHVDADELDELVRAWRLVRTAQARFDRIARQEGWPTPFAAARYLILTHLGRATAFGLSPRSLARLLSLPPSSLAHHLDVLEDAGLVRRAPRAIRDRRKVAVRLTDAGRYALRRLGAQPSAAIDSPAIARP